MKAVIYTRVSTKDQVTNLSLGTQLKACRDYCQREGFEILREFTDAGESAKTIALIGDGGAMLMIGELATAVEERANIAFVLMNDQGYGVIRNIQDAQYGGHRAYADLLTPNFSLLCASIGLPHEKVDVIDGFEAALERALAAQGPALIEVDMVKIGPFAESFAGPPAGSAGSVK